MSKNYFSKFAKDDFSCGKSQKKSCKYDYIIVGAGCSGSILARKLSDDKKTHVLLLEKGTDTRTSPTVLDPNILNSWKSVTYDPDFAECYGIPLFNPFDSYTYTEGVGLGGGGSHNYMIAVRGTPSNTYNEWATLSGNSSWSYNNLLPKMKAMENYQPNGTSIDTSQRGTGGPISIVQVSPPLNSNTAVQTLATGINTPIIPDYNDPNNGDVGVSATQQFNTGGSNNRRSYSGLDYLGPDVLDNNGNGVNGRKLKVIYNAHVNYVIFKGKAGNKAVGIHYVLGEHKDKKINAYGAEIILSAGSLNSASILERSGVGNQSILQPLGIKTIVNNVNVGEHLRNQYGNNTVLSATSPFPSSGFQIFTDLNPYYPDDGVRRAQLIGVNIGGNNLKLVNFITQTKVEGSSHIISTDPFKHPRIRMPFFTDDVKTPGTDSYNAVAMLKVVKNIPGITVLAPPPSAYPTTFPGGTYPDDSGLIAYSKSINGIAVANHIIGTTQMGTSVSNSVVDGEGKVWGTKHLRVYDVGISPISEDGNNAYSAYMIGIQGAQFLGINTPPAL